MALSKPLLGILAALAGIAVVAVASSGTAGSYDVDYRDKAKDVRYTTGHGYGKAEGEVKRTYATRKMSAMSSTKARKRVRRAGSLPNAPGERRVNTRTLLPPDSPGHRARTLPKSAGGKEAVVLSIQRAQPRELASRAPARPRGGAPAR